MARLSTLALALSLAVPAAAQPVASQDAPSSPPVLSAPARVSIAASSVEPGAISLDGRLDEAAWGQAAIATGFVQLRPDQGKPASERTEARVLVDGRSVYVGMRMHDSQPDRINAQLGRRDSGFESDWALVAFDSYNDDRTAFGFQVSAAGVQSDFLFYDDVNEDDSWDAVWDVATSRDEAGWTAEFRIPLSQLRFASSEGEQRWGLEFSRRHFRTNEQSFWAPLDPNANGTVSQFGVLTGLRGLQAPRALEVQPYVAASVTRAPGDTADPFYSATDAEPRVGLDVKYGLTSDLTLTATVNPDFGQVEADPAQVNLGGFELFFQERRPFFIEGLDAFNMQPRRFFANNRPDLLYTRRIGRSPQRSSFVSSGVYDAAGLGDDDDGTNDGVVYTDAPQQSTILGAAKLSGRVGRFSVGLLNATTASEYGRFQAFDVGGQQVADDRALVEPLSNYLVGRTRATFGKTIVGGLLTSTVRDTGDPAIEAMMPSTATVAGLDLEHTLGSWTVTGQVAGSLVAGSAGSIARLQRSFPRLYQRPDADHLSYDETRTSLAGFTAEANLLKTSGEHWVGGVHGSMTSPGFDSNDLGFQSRADYVSVGGVWVYQQNQPQGPFQSWSANSFFGGAWNTGGDRIGTFVGGNANGRFKNFWRVNMNFDVVPRFDDDRLTRGGPIARRDAGGSFNVNVRTDDRKVVSGYVYGNTFGNELGRSGLFGGGGVEIRPGASLTVSLGPEFGLRDDPRQYVDAFDDPAAEATFGRRYVFGQLDASEVALEARANWTFSPDLSLQLYARPFATRGQYSAFKHFDRPGAFRLPEYGVDLGTATENADGSTTIDPGDGGDPFTVRRDFTVRSLQGNAVLRWQYRPGSTVFLVWQQQRSGSENDGDLRFGRDVRGLFSDPVQNVFLVKLSYWLGG